jgi:hypothetical protein
MVSERRDEAGLSVLCWGCGSRSVALETPRLVMGMPRIYNSRLPRTPLLRAQTIVCGEMYMHMRCTYCCIDGWLDEDLDWASLVYTECLHEEKHIPAIAAHN